MNTDIDEMEMPTPCRKCGIWFDLNDGWGSKKWFPDTVICGKCHDEESREMENDYEIEDLHHSISDAQITITDAISRLKELGESVSQYSHITF